MKKYLKSGFAFLLTAALSGCAIANIASEPAPQFFMLTAAHPEGAGTTVAPAANLLIDDFSTTAAIDVPRIVFQPNPNEIKYYAGARWSDRAPQMIQSLMVETLENSGRFASVAARGSGIRGDYLLKGDIRQFAAEARGEQTAVRMDFYLRLVRIDDRSVLASRDFDVSVPVTGSGITSVVAAYDAALHQNLSEIMLWASAETAKAPVVARK